MKTLSLFFLYNFGILVSLFKYYVLIRVLEFENKLLEEKIIIRYKSSLN